MKQQTKTTGDLAKVASGRRAERVSDATSKESPATDLINHPPHYIGNGLEVIDVIEDWGLGFHLGNAVKYVLRAGRKGDAGPCLAKAIWYIRRARDLPKGVLRAPAARPYTIGVRTVAEAFAVTGHDLDRALFAVRMAAWSDVNAEILSMLDAAEDAIARVLRGLSKHDAPSGRLPGGESLGAK